MIIVIVSITIVTMVLVLLLVPRSGILSWRVFLGRERSPGERSWISRTLPGESYCYCYCCHCYYYYYYYYVYIYIYMHIHTYIIHVYMYIYIYICIHICIYIYIYTHVCILGQEHSPGAWGVGTSWVLAEGLQVPPRLLRSVFIISNRKISK